MNAPTGLTISAGQGDAAFYALDIIPRLPRETLETLVERAIDRLDEMDPDPDLEANGDEDDFWLHNNWHGEPGCPIADPDSVDDI